MNRTLTTIWLLMLVWIMLLGCSTNQSTIQPTIEQELTGNNQSVIRQVAADNPNNGKPMVVPAVTPSSGGVPLLVHFWDNGSYDPDEDQLLSWEWNFADEEEGQGGWHDYTATQGDAWHTYSSAGTYTAHLRITDSTGKKGIGHIQIILADGLNANPIATASANPTFGNAPLMVTFSTSGSYDPDGTIVKYEWDLGDGIFQDYTTTNGETSHTYTTDGTYLAILRVMDDGGAVGTNSVMVEVLPQITQQGDWWMFGHDPQHTRRSPFIGPTTSALKWVYTAGGWLQSSPAIGADGTVYMGSYDNNLYAINPDGTLKWTYTTGSYVHSSPAIGVDGIVYVGSYDNNLYAINPNGTIKWSYAMGSWVFSSPAIGTDGTVYVGSRDKKLYAVNPNGTLKWAYTTGSYVYSSPAIGTDGTVYVGSYDNKLYAINPDGTLKWSYQTGGSITYSSPAIGADGTVYVGSSDFKLYAINSDGTLKWVYTTLSWVTSSPAIGEDGTVYVGSRSGDNKLYAINPDGTLKWSYITGPSSDVGSPAIGADGTVYVGGGNNLYAINPDGTGKWYQYDPSGNAFTSPAIGADGTVYVENGSGKLYAIGPG